MTLLREQPEAAWRRTLAASDRLELAERQAFTDPLTDARNRWFLERHLGRLGSRAPDIAVIAIDLDGFKALNDTYGHVAGDEALRASAGVGRVTPATLSLEAVDAALYAAKRRGGGAVVDVTGAAGLDDPADVGH